MTEYRVKKMKKITAKIAGLYEELELMLDAELRNIDEYSACEEVCRHMGGAGQLLRSAAYEMQQAEACTELEEMQNNMQTSMDQMTG